MNRINKIGIAGFALALLTIFIFFLLGGGVTADPSPDNTFSLIVLPDTQYYSESYPAIFTNQTQWIADNTENMNIGMVIFEGDLVDNYNSDVEWQRANDSISVLDGVVPYSVVPGNHDHPTTKYSEYFPSSRYENESWWGGSYNSNTNNYQLLTINGYDFIFLSLDWSPSSDEISWANNVLNTYSDRWAILTTHGYLDDTTATREGIHGMPSDSAEYIWNDLVKKHEKLFLVLCGHEHDSGEDGEARRTDVNNYGEDVHQLLANYQSYPNGGNGWLRILNITIHDNQKNELSVKTYSPYLNEYATDDTSQFDLLFDGVGATYPWTFPVTFGADGSTYNITLPAGWSIIGWTNSTATTAHSMGGMIGDNCTFVTERNVTTGEYVTHVMTGPADEDNFAINRGWGYFVKLSAETLWERDS